MSALLIEPRTTEQKKNRIKFGITSLLFNGDEQAFAPLHTAVIRALGGGDVLLGFMGATIQSIGLLFAWIGALILKATKMHRRALIHALIAGGVSQGLIVGTLLLGHASPALSGVLLFAYIILVTGMSMLSGAQHTILVSWVGELVKPRQRGWFVSGMAIIANVGLVLLQLLFARLARDAGLPGYAWLMGIVMIDTVAACFLVATTTDRAAKPLNFISRRNMERVNHAFKPLWGLICFQCAWSGGRVALVAFSTAYLIDHFGMRMDRIILIFMITDLVNIVMLFLMGRLSPPGIHLGCAELRGARGRDL